MHNSLSIAGLTLECNHYSSSNQRQEKQIM